MFIWLALCCALLFVLAVVPEAKFPTSIFGVVALSLQFYDGSKGVDFQFIQFIFSCFVDRRHKFQVLFFFF